MNSRPPRPKSSAPSPPVKAPPEPPAQVAATDDVPPPFATLGRQASYAMMVLAALLALSLAGWFIGHSDAPWTFASTIALVSLLGAGADAWLVWKDPSRVHLGAGLAVIAFSILRVGSPTDWTAATALVLTITAILTVPVARAWLALPRA